MLGGKRVLIKGCFSRWLDLNFKHLPIFQKLLLLSPLFLFASYHPAVQLTVGSSSIRITPALAYVCLLAILSVPIVIRKFSKISKSHKATFYILVTSLIYATLSLSWTTDIVRGLFTIFLYGALTLIFLGALSTGINRGFIKGLVTVLLATSLAWCLFALSQLIIGLFYPDVLPQFCNSCSASAFGFVRPAGLMFEPQIFGNILLAPILVVAYYILTLSDDKTKVLHRVTLFILLATLILTLSRGAIYSAILGFAVLFIVVPKTRRILEVAMIAVIGAVFSVLLQGVAAQVNPHISTSFYRAVNSSIEQLSLGKVSLPDVENNEVVDRTGDAPVQEHTDSKEAPIYDGYAEISTNYRLDMTSAAIDNWSQDIRRFLFGTGAGSGAQAISRQYDTVQNQHVEILLNYGVVGYGLFAALIIRLFVLTDKHRFLWSIIVAYLFQWLFFSGLPHGSFHVYFVLAFCYLYCLPSSLPNSVEKKSQQFKQEPL